MMGHFIRDTAARLNQRVESLCREYLSCGCKSGRFWIAGSIDNDKGSSFVVHLTGDRQGKFFENSGARDPGDMLDLVQHVHDLPDCLTAAKYAAEHLLHLPVMVATANRSKPQKKIGKLVVDASRVRKSQALFNRGVAIPGTLAEKYLASRMLTGIDGRDLRFVDDCYYYQDENTPLQKLPALLQGIRGDDGAVFSVNRTYLKEDGSGKADVAQPKKVTVNFEGYGVALGEQIGDSQIVGEGFETVGSFHMAVPQFPALAGLSRYHASVVHIRKGVKRIILAQDNDDAGNHLRDEMQLICDDLGIELISVLPLRNDFNEDHMELGYNAMKANILEQILAQVLLGEGIK